MNKVILLGRLTRDAEIRYTQGNPPTAVAKFCFAVQRKYKSEGQECDFINCTAFGKQAEFIEKYTHKGIKLLIEGRWQTGSYTNKDGNKVYINECIVESCEFAEKRRNDEVPQEASQTDSDGFMPIPDDLESELPFQ